MGSLGSQLSDDVEDNEKPSEETNIANVFEGVATAKKVSAATAARLARKKAEKQKKLEEKAKAIDESK